MEKQFLSDVLQANAESLKRADTDGYMIAHENGETVVLFYTGPYLLCGIGYESDDIAGIDLSVLKEMIPDMKELTEVVKLQNVRNALMPADQSPGIDTSKLPADYKPNETAAPSQPRDQQLAADLAQLKDAGLTGYRLGVTTKDYPYPLSLLRGNSVAFHYDYLTNPDRANDLGLVLDILPNLQLVGAPDFVS